MPDAPKVDEAKPGNAQAGTQLKPAGQAAKAEADEKPKERLFEVMTDVWGHTPQFKRGDLLRESQIPYDVENALMRGSIREAPEYADSGMESSTQPGGEKAD